MLKENHPCANCTTCCEHVSLPIPTPEDFEDWNNILWYVIHKNVIVYTDDDDDWFIEFKTKCKELDEKGLCKIYNNRPIVCREYSSDCCEMHGEGAYFKHRFTSKDEVTEFVKNNTKFTKFPSGQLFTTNQ